MRKDMAPLKELILTHEKAKAYAAAVHATQIAQRELEQAYVTWKQLNRVEDFVERGSVTWKAMMLGTEVYYRALVNAKARQRRAQQKLLKVLEGA